jgi:hypothetical protein
LRNGSITGRSPPSGGAKTPVASFLPAYWRPHFTLGQISFRSLLRHESGLGRALNPTGTLNENSGPGNFATAKQFAFIGGPQDGQRDYKNLNYILLRVMFATLTGTLPASFTVSPAFDDTLWDFISATAYRNFVNDRVFTAANIGPFDFKAGADAARPARSSPT